MVVPTAYEFDVEAWRSTVDGEPSVVAVDIGTGGHRAAWERLELAGGLQLRLHDDGPAGIRRVVLARPPTGGAPAFSIGDVEFDFARR